MAHATDAQLKALRDAAQEEIASLEYSAAVTVHGLSEKGERCLANARTTIAALGELAALRTSVASLREAWRANETLETAEGSLAAWAAVESAIDALLALDAARAPAPRTEPTP